MIHALFRVPDNAGNRCLHGTGFNGVRAVTQNVYGDVSAARKFLGVIVRNRDEGIGLHALKGVKPFGFIVHHKHNFGGTCRVKLRNERP